MIDTQDIYTPLAVSIAKIKEYDLFDILLFSMILIYVYNVLYY